MSVLKFTKNNILLIFFKILDRIFYEFFDLSFVTIQKQSSGGVL